MRLEIRSRGLKLSPELRGHLRERLRVALGRFAHSIDRVRVYFRDRSEPRDGLSKKCRVVVDLHRRGSVVVTGEDADVFAVIARTVNRAGFAVRRHVKRPLARRRPPRRRVPAAGPME
jgi:ribosome-associated translation inhibitor RaiA